MSAPDSRLLTRRKELDRATQALNRLYEAVEKDLLPTDETLRKRAHKLKAKREEALLEIAKLDARKHQAMPKVRASSAQAFAKVLQSRLKDVRNGFGKAYLRILVDEIRLEGDELKIRGSYAKLGETFGMLEKLKLGEVPGFIPD